VVTGVNRDFSYTPVADFSLNLMWRSDVTQYYHIYFAGSTLRPSLVIWRGGGAVIIVIDMLSVVDAHAGPNAAAER
jgi:hypothetical protein